MAIATTKNGDLNPIKGKYPDCYIQIGTQSIYMDILPDISDGKNVGYQTEGGIGRASPFNIFKYSEIRTVGWTCHFIVQKNNSNEDSKSVSVNKILRNIRLIQSACYPEDEYGKPPPICRLKCGDLLDEGDGICAVLKSYSIKFDTSVPWDETTLLPYKIDVDLQFDVVYDQSDLPVSKKIVDFGY
jgi:hypothetical protein